MGWTLQALSGGQHYIVRTGLHHVVYGDLFWEIGVVVTDNGDKTALLQALCPETKFKTHHYRDLYDAMAHMGLRPIWYRSNGEDEPMTKRTIPSHNETPTDESKIAAVILVLEQLGYTVTKTGTPHYIVQNLSVSTTHNEADKSVNWALSGKTVPLDASAPAEPHGVSA